MSQQESIKSRLVTLLEWFVMAAIAFGVWFVHHLSNRQEQQRYDHLYPIPPQEELEGYQAVIRYGLIIYLDDSEQAVYVEPFNSRHDKGRY